MRGGSHGVLELSNLRLEDGDGVGVTLPLGGMGRLEPLQRGGVLLLRLL